VGSFYRSVRLSVESTEVLTTKKIFRVEMDAGALHQAHMCRTILCDTSCIYVSILLFYFNLKIKIAHQFQNMFGLSDTSLFFFVFVTDLSQRQNIPSNCRYMLIVFLNRYVLSSCLKT
jgi:hypothetical protein